MEEGLNLKGLITKIREKVKYLRQNIKVIFSVVIISGVLGVCYAHFSETKYKGDSSFYVISSEGGGGLSSLMGMASSLGILGSSGGGITDEKVTEILKSKRIIMNAALNDVQIDGKKVKLVNYFIDKFEVREKLLERDPVLYKDFKFTGDEVYNLSPLENKVEQYIFGQIKDLLDMSFDKPSGIVSVECVSKDEFFSYHLTKFILSELTTFYVSKETQKERETFEILKDKTDSIKNVISAVEVNLASLKDNSLKTIKMKGKLNEMRLTRELSILNVMYSTSVSNLEMARVTLLDSRPFIQIVDQPIFPLKRVEKSPIFFGVFFALLFGFMCVFFFIIKHEVSTVMAKD